MHNDNDRTFLHRNLAVGVRRVKYGGFGCAYVRLHLAQVQVHKLVPTCASRDSTVKSTKVTRHMLKNTMKFWDLGADQLKKLF
jgi:hypothetical protein